MGVLDAGAGASSASWTNAASSPQKSDAAQAVVGDSESLFGGACRIGTVCSSGPSQLAAWPWPSEPLDEAPEAGLSPFCSASAVGGSGRDSDGSARDSVVRPPIGTSSSSDSSHWRGRRGTTLLAPVVPVLPSRC
jgi:hypothetical protein